MRTGDRAAGPWPAKSLGRNGYPPSLSGSQPNGPGHGPENIAGSVSADFLVRRRLGARLLRIFEFPISRFKGGRNRFQVPVYAHQLLEDLDSLLTRLVRRPPGLLTIVISLQLRVGEKLLAFLLGLLPGIIDRGLVFGGHPVQFGLDLCLGFVILGLAGV